MHLVDSERDRTRYTAAARRKGLTQSAWLRAATTDRLDRRVGAEPFRAEDNVWWFCANRDARTACDTEPDWEQHLGVIQVSRGRAIAGA